ncbi:MAG TPA: hypothetical protein VIQ31_33145 [Phormidium sp.]
MRRCTRNHNLHHAASAGVGIHTFDPILVSLNSHISSITLALIPHQLFWQRMKSLCEHCQLYGENYIDENQQTTESGSGIYKRTPAGTTNAAYGNGTKRSATLGTFHQARRNPLRA